MAGLGYTLYLWRWKINFDVGLSIKKSQVLLFQSEIGQAASSAINTLFPSSDMAFYILLGSLIGMVLILWIGEMLYYRYGKKVLRKGSGSNRKYGTFSIAVWAGGNAWIKGEILHEHYNLLTHSLCRHLPHMSPEAKQPSISQQAQCDILACVHRGNKERIDTVAHALKPNSQMISPWKYQHRSSSQFSLLCTVFTLYSRV